MIGREKTDKQNFKLEARNPKLETLSSKQTQMSKAQNSNRMT